MHYKNGREAHNGEPVLTKDAAGRVQVGLLYDINPGTTTCNAMISRVIGGCLYTTVSDCFHAEDAYQAIETPPEPPVQEAPTPPVP